MTVIPSKKHHHVLVLRLSIHSDDKMAEEIGNAIAQNMTVWQGSITEIQHFTLDLNPKGEKNVRPKEISIHNESP